jgi:hypothetical protein
MIESDFNLYFVRKEVKKMGKKYPKRNQEIIERAVNALSTIAPDATFKGFGLAQLAPQAERCMTPRRRIAEIATLTTEQIALRESEDETALAMIEKIIIGIIADDAYGKDSALYEAFGFVRESNRKSGLTRKKKKEVKEMK